MADLLDSLNPEQYDAVTTDDSHVLCVAGPGTGKTHTLTRRVAHRLINIGTHPSRILCLTFTNKAAEEMRTRITALVGDREAKRLTIGTFHSVCFRIIKQWAQRLGYVGESLTVYDDVDRNDILKAIAAEANKKIPANIFEKAAIDLGCRAISPDEIENRDLKFVLAEYRDRMFQNNAVDFVTILTEVNRLFRENPDVLEYYHDLWRETFVDEYQDTDRSQYNLHRLINPEQIFAIGDPDQAIYGFRGADQSIILQFEADYPGAKIVKLNRNYRSTVQIVAAANNLIAHNASRIPNPLISERDGSGVQVRDFSAPFAQATAIADAITRLRTADPAKYPLKSFAVLYRKNAAARQVAECLKAAEIPHQILTSERDFYAEAPVRGFIRLLRLIANPRDTYCLQSVVNWPVLRCTKEGWHTLRLASIRAEMSPAQFVCDYTSTKAANPNTAGEHMKGNADISTMLARFAQTVIALHELSTQGFPVDAIADTADQQLCLSEFYRDQRLTTKAALIEKLHTRLREWAASQPEAHRTVQDYIAWFALRSQQDSLRQAEDSVRMLTVHAAKGLEWDTVFVIDSTERDFKLDKDPAPEAIEEERRVFYVACTRARDNLFITWPKMATPPPGSNKAIINSPIRFIDEALAPK